MQHLMQASRQPAGAEYATADMLMQEALQPPHAQPPAPVCADTCMQDAVDSADGGTDSTLCADAGRRDASQPDEEPQQHSIRAIVEDVHIAVEAPSDQQECMPMHEATLSVDMVRLQPASTGTEQAPKAPVAADSARQEIMRPSSAGMAMGDMQLAPLGAAAETLARSASAPLLSKDCVEAAPIETTASEEQHAAAPEGGHDPGAN